jgi:hypothetical protein
MSDTHTITRHWALVNGVREASSDMIAVHTARSTFLWGSGPEQVLLVSAESDPIYRTGGSIVAQALQQSLLTKPSRSVTSSLRHAFNAAHAALQANRKSSSQHTKIGATCAVLQNDDVFIAQVLPSQAFVFSAGQIYAFPPSEAWSNHDGTVQDWSARYSTKLAATPNLFRVSLDSSTVVVLCSSNIRQLVSLSEAQQLFEQGDADAIAETLYERCKAAGLVNAHLLVLQTQPGSVTNGHSNDDWSTFPPTIRPMALEQLKRRFGWISPAKSDMVIKPQHVATPPKQELQGNAATSTNDATVEDISFKRRGNIEQNSRRRARHRAQNHHSRYSSLLWIYGLLLGIAIIVLLVVGFQQVQANHGSLADTALSKVETALVAASSTSDEQIARQQLATAETALRNDVDPLVQSGTITDTRPAVWSRYQQLLANYDRIRAQVNHIEFLEPLQNAASLTSKQASIDQVLLGATSEGAAAPSLVYLDRNNGVLYQQGRKEPLLRPRMQIDGIAVPALDQVLQDEDGTLIALVSAVDNRPSYRVLYRNGNAWTAEELPLPETLAGADAVPAAVYNGNLYLWDSRVKQVWRYASGQYANLPTPWIEDAGTASLENVVDIAVDGRLYLLKHDGRVLVFEGGRQVKQIATPELSIPVTFANRFVITEDTFAEDGVTVQRYGYIFLLDARNERVLQLSKEDGKLVKQFQTRSRGPLNQLNDIAVDETNHMLYLANGAELLRASMPPLLPQMQADAAATPSPSASPEP